MRTAQVCPTCATYINAVCVLYDGPYLPNLDIEPLTDVSGILEIIDDYVGNLQPSLGYVPENVANKTVDMFTSSTSNTMYPSAKAVADWTYFMYEPKLTFTPENIINKSTDNTMGGLTPSNTLYPSQKATKEFVENYVESVLPKEYVVYFEQVFGNPSVQILKNTLGAPIVWTRLSTGDYQGVLVGAFPASKTFITQNIHYFISVDKVLTFIRLNNDTILAQCRNISTGTPVDLSIVAVPLEIRVYP
jgi:hypothetical protein